jgi:hypothetical protein
MLMAFFSRFRHGARIPVLLLTAFVLCLTACTPTFNWREVRPEGLGFAVLLPDRPASLSREIDLDGVPLTMTMTGARIDHSLFTVGMVELPPTALEHAERAVAAMRAGMLRNIAAQRSEERAISLSVTDPSGRVSERQAGVWLEASGTVNRQAVRMTALFVARGPRLWQVVAIEPEGRADQAATMIDSFRILE